MSDVPIKVRVGDDHIDLTEQLRRAVEDAGLHVRTVIPELGLIYGDGEARLVEQLPELEGIEAVETEGSVSLPPLTEKVPQ